MLAQPPHRRALATAAVAVGVASLALAQFTDRVEVAIGTLEVVVLDRDHRSVGGLTRQEFHVSVDGVEREITHFSPCSSAAAPTAVPVAGAESVARPAEAPRDEAAPSLQRPGLLVILVDNQNVAVFNRNHLMKRVADWIGDRLRPPDRAMVVVNETSLRTACPPTSDAAEVARVVGEELGRSTAMSSIQVEVQVSESQIRDLKNNRGSGLDQALAIARFHATHMGDHVRRTVAALESLIGSLAGVEGRKDLVYVSDGLPMTPGLELYVLIDELFGYGRAAAGTVEGYAGTAGKLYEELAAAANRTGVTLHAIDARGLDVSSGIEASRAYDRGVTGASRVGIERLRNGQDSLLYLAARTGGVAVVNSNKFEEGLARIGDAVDRCYSLAFSLDDVAVDETHNVEVELTRPGRYELRYRPMIEPRSLSTRVSDRTVANLAFPPTENALAVTLTLGQPQRVSRKLRRVPLTLKVPAAGLMFLKDDEGAAATVTLFAVALDEEGLRSEVRRETHVLRRPPPDDDRPLVIETAAEVGRGPIRISVGLLDVNGQTAGYAVAEVDAR